MQGRGGFPRPWQSSCKCPHHHLQAEGWVCKWWTGLSIVICNCAMFRFTIQFFWGWTWEVSRIYKQPFLLCIVHTLAHSNCANYPWISMRQTPLGFPLGKNSRSASWEKRVFADVFTKPSSTCQGQMQKRDGRKCSTKVLLKILDYSHSCLLQPCSLLIHSFEIILLCNDCVSIIATLMWWGCRPHCWIGS